MSNVCYFMEKAIEIAKNSLLENPCDIPVGCVIVKDDEILSIGFNTCERNKSITGHAEINALEAAAKKIGSNHLNGCQIFITLEPCPMCAGAIRSAQIEEIYFGAFSLNDGSAGTVYNLFPKKTKIFGGGLFSALKKHKPDETQIPLLQ